MLHGTVRTGLVVDADPRLSGPPRNEPTFDGYAVVLMAPELSGDAAVDLLREVSKGLWTRQADSDIEDQRRSVLEQLRATWPFPSFVKLPSALTQRHSVWCTSLMVVRRHVPFGYLRCARVPLLVAADRCPYVMVVPRKYWNAAWQEMWAAGIK
jgi:hypothetical protein